MTNQSKGRSGGVLQINAAATKKNATSQKSGQRSSAPRLRLIIRRLPPGLTELEFWESLGPEWQTGKGKVDWFAYKPGKISKDLSKPSRPSRAYLKVKDQTLLDTLSIRVKQTQFKDAKNTGSDPCLVGPPSLEFAPYTKVPGGRIRNDGRQGTIDQDQEFIDFLQSLTEPITRSTANGSDPEAKQEKVTITPLVQFIKEKKANKAKDKQAAAAKSSKKEDSKETKIKAESRPTIVVKSSNSTVEKARVAKATQETVKAINKSVASMQTKQTAKPETKAKEPTPAAAPTPKRERERGSASAAARMISRDLGLTPKEPRTARAARNTSTTAPAAEVKTVPTPTTSTPTTPTTKPTASTTPATNVAPPTGPRNSRAATPQAKQPQQQQQAPQRQAKPVPQLSTGAKSAFLKHANPSQGVTEELLRTKFAVFGEITRCEIDKKKGLGYIDFADTESLKKAMVASPVKVGNGQVVVLENRSPYRKGIAPQRGGDAAAAQALQSASVATSTTTSPKVTAATSAPMPAATAAPVQVETPAVAAPAPEATTTQTTAAAASTPTAPRGAKNAAGSARSGRGGAGGGANVASHRGNSGNRASRGGHRGGRGGRAARGGAATATNGPATVAPAASAPAAAPAPTAS